MARITMRNSQKASCSEVPLQNAHQTRNRVMVDRSDLVVLCIQPGRGGAWQTMKYAKKQGKNYINLNDQMEEAE